MNRNFFTNYLVGENCHPDETDQTKDSQLWYNLITGDSVYIPYAEELKITAWGHIIDMLHVAPPVEFDADYHVYEGFRDQAAAIVQSKLQ